MTFQAIYNYDRENSFGYEKDIELANRRLIHPSVVREYNRVVLPKNYIFDDARGEDVSAIYCVQEDEEDMEKYMESVYDYAKQHEIVVTEQEQKEFEKNYYQNREKEGRVEQEEFIKVQYPQLLTVELDELSFNKAENTKLDKEISLMKEVIIEGKRADKRFINDRDIEIRQIKRKKKIFENLEKLLICFKCYR